MTELCHHMKVDERSLSLFFVDCEIGVANKRIETKTEKR